MLYFFVFPWFSARTGLDGQSIINLHSRTDLEARSDLSSVCRTENYGALRLTSCSQPASPNETRKIEDALLSCMMVVSDATPSFSQTHARLCFGHAHLSTRAALRDEKFEGFPEVGGNNCCEHHYIARKISVYLFHVFAPQQMDAHRY